MKAAFARWVLLFALANAFVYQSVEWANNFLIYSYQERRINEESHAMIAAEIPRFDLLPSSQWEEAARTFHERWQTPAKLSNIDQHNWGIWHTSDYFASRVTYDYSFPGGAFAYVLLKDKYTILEIGPLPGMMLVSGLDNLVAIFLWFLINGAAMSWMMYSLHKRLRAVEKATTAFLTDGAARLIEDDSGDTLGLAVRSVNLMAVRAEQLLRQRSQLIHEQRELLHAVAHESRAPLARLNFALEMLVRSESDTQRRQLSREMENAITELDSLVRELLSYARLQHGAQKLEFAETDVATIVDDVVDKTKSLFPSIVFATEDQGLSNKATVDPRLFARVVTNLVRNAAAFAHGQVQVLWCSVEGQLEVRVDDDGPGVPIDQRERIFEPFVRLDPSRARDSGGTGLGLAIVKGISERHRGQVFVEDSPLGGARFVLRWPLTP